MEKKQGLYCVIASVTIQLIPGIAYIWSIFQTGIAQSVFGGDNAAAGLTFSILLLSLTTSAGIGGKLAIKYNTRKVVFAGGIIMGIGFIITSRVTGDAPWLLWISYGVLGGAGMGFTYSTTIACAQKWYPHKKGLITGIIIAGLGFSGVVFTPIIEAMIRGFGGIGFGEFNTILVLGIIGMVVCAVGSIFLKNPPEGYMTMPKTALQDSQKVNQTPDLTPKEMMKSPKFYLAAGTFLLACMAGQMIIGFARPIAAAREGLESVAPLGVMLIAISNSTGRIIWGIVSDKFGRNNTILLLLTGTAAASLFVMLVPGGWLFVLIALIAFFFGGLMVSFPPLTADLFGLKNLSANYGIVLISFGIGAIVAMQIAGYYMNIADTSGEIIRVFPAFVIATLCAVAGIVLMLILKRIRDRQ